MSGRRKGKKALEKSVSPRRSASPQSSEVPKSPRRARSPIKGSIGTGSKKPGPVEENAQIPNNVSLEPINEDLEMNN
jgi:hypothetical protein